MLNRLINFFAKEPPVSHCTIGIVARIPRNLCKQQDGGRCISRPYCTYSCSVYRSSWYGSQEVEKLVTFPIETAVNGATNVRRVRSSLVRRYFYCLGRV